MRWTVEVDTGPNVVSWPEELDELLTALRSHPAADRVASHVDVPTGSVSALFQVRATSKGEAEMLARRVMAEALERTGLDKPAKTVHFVAVTPSPAVGVGPRARDVTSPF